MAYPEGLVPIKGNHAGCYAKGVSSWEWGVLAGTLWVRARVGGGKAFVTFCKEL